MEEDQIPFIGEKSVNWKCHIKKGLLGVGLAGAIYYGINAADYRGEKTRSINVDDTTIKYVTEDRKWFPDKHRIEIYDKNENLIIKHQGYWPVSKKGQLVDREGKDFDTYFDF